MVSRLNWGVELHCNIMPARNLISNDLNDWPYRRSLTSTNACLDVFSAEEYTVVMVADPGTFSGTPEALHYEESLQNNVSVPSGLLLCPRITVGTLFGQPTIIATSGEISDASFSITHSA